MRDKILKSIFTIFSIIWMVIIFTEYWRYNPNYSKAIQLFHYYDLLILIVLTGAGITWYFKKPRKKAIGFINGLTIFLGLIFLDIIAVNRFCSNVNNIDFNSSSVFSQVGHIIGISLCVFLVYLVVRVLGALFTTILPIRIINSDMPLIQAAIGIMLLTFVLFFLGLIGLLNGFVIIPICLIILSVYWRYSYQVIKSTLLTPIKIPEHINALGIFSFLFLAVFLVLNFVQILRPFPIGSDSLRLYVNLPSLLAEHGGLVDGHQPYNWSLFMSLGKVVFGRIDAVLALSFLGGVLSLVALYRLSRKWLDVNYSALVLLLFYSLPMISFLSFMDMKIDMALMFMTLSILLLYYNWAVPVEKTKEIKLTKGIGLLKAKSFFNKHIPSVLKQNGILVSIGLLAGFAFGIKFTVLFFFLALFSTIWYFKGDKLTFITSFFLCFAAIFLLQLDAQPGLRQFHQYIGVLQWSLLAVGIGLMGYLFVKQKKKLMELMTYSLIIGSFFALPVLPWLGKNFSETGDITVFALLNGKKASPSFHLGRVDNKTKNDKIIIPGLYQMPDAPDAPDAVEPKVKDKSKKRNRKANKAISEDLHRFMGYEVLPVRYLSIPYDTFVKTNISGFFTDVGFILLLFLPFLFLFQRSDSSDWNTIIAKGAFIILSILLLIISVPSAFMNQNNLNNTVDGLALLDASQSTDFFGQISDATNRTLLTIYTPIHEWLATSSLQESMTYPLMIILFLIILYLFFVRTKKHTKITQSVIVCLSMYFFLWWILGSGVPWYGILIFSLPFIFLVKSIALQEEDNHDDNNFDMFGSVKKYAFLSIGVIWVLLSFVHRTSNYEPVDDQRAKNLFYPAIMDYQMKNLSEEKAMDYHFPNVRQLVKTINRDKKAYVYMVGSPFRYFINKNDQRVLSDIYLDFFDQMIQRLKTKEKIIGKLKEEGFKYIVFDLNMFSYDVTPEKTLTRKFIQFMNTLYRNPGVELVATDRKIKSNQTGQEIFAVFQDEGDITVSGKVAIFKIK